jgi:hypothetical protein
MLCAQCEKVYAERRRGKFLGWMGKWCWRERRGKERLKGEGGIWRDWKRNGKRKKEARREKRW